MTSWRPGRLGWRATSTRCHGVSDRYRSPRVVSSRRFSVSTWRSLAAAPAPPAGEQGGPPFNRCPAALRSPREGTHSPPARRAGVGEARHASAFALLEPATGGDDPADARVRLDRLGPARSPRFAAPRG